MQQHSGRLRWTVLPVALRVVGAVGLCVAALSFLAFHSAPHASATGLPILNTSAVSSSPSSGPVGTTISVSGSGWGGSDGTPVSFGYEVTSGGNTTCQTVSDAQDGSLSGGSFAGWFRWPSGTSLNTYQVCAMIGNVLAAAGSFTVLSSSPPAVSISPTTLAPGTQATITASNYYPAGTSINFLWMWGNTVIENLGSAASDTSGNAILTFTVSKLSIATGLYSIDASTSDGPPPTLFSSTNFTYSAPAASPSPTPQPSPSPSHTPSPTKTPGVTPTTATTTPAATPTTKASATATATSPTASASPTAGNGQTPTTNGTNAGNTGNTNTDTSTPSSLNNPLLIGGMGILSGALLLGMIALLLMRRRRNMARAEAAIMPPAPPSWVNTQSVPMNNGAMLPPFNPGLPVNGSLAGNPNSLSYPSYNPFSAPAMPSTPPAPAPVLVGAGVMAGNGSAAAPAAYPDPDEMPAAPASPQLPTWLNNPPGVSAPPSMSIPADPALDAIRRQAQSGLFVLPRSFKDERSQ